MVDILVTINDDLEVIDNGVIMTKIEDKLSFRVGNENEFLKINIIFEEKEKQKDPIDWEPISNNEGDIKIRINLSATKGGMKKPFIVGEIDDRKLYFSFWWEKFFGEELLSSIRVTYSWYLEKEKN